MFNEHAGAANDVLVIEHGQRCFVVGPRQFKVIDKIRALMMVARETGMAALTTADLMSWQPGDEVSGCVEEERQAGEEHGGFLTEAREGGVDEKWGSE